MQHYSTVVRKTRTALDRAHATLITPLIRQSIARRQTNTSELFKFVVYFADSVDLLYQVKQWIGPLEKLASTGHRVALVVHNALTARELMTLSNLPILLTRSMVEIEQFIESHDVRVVFYVNNSQYNFTALRMTRPIHVHLSHGESEKSSMTSHQLKAYDYAFIAGDAAAQRILSNIQRIDPSYLVHIGRPQLDIDIPITSTKKRTISVLYAPTWEGDSKAMEYSSLNTIGPRLVKELLADERFTLVFRPHPKTGSWSRKTAKALQNIKDEISRSEKKGAPLSHRIDTAANPTWSIAVSDIVIADNSAIAMDAIGLEKPLLAVSPESTKNIQLVGIDPHTLFGAVPSIGADYDGPFTEAILSIMNLGIRDTQIEFRRHVFGGTEFGTGTERFISASQHILETYSAT